MRTIEQVKTENEGALCLVLGGEPKDWKAYNLQIGRVKGYCCRSATAFDERMMMMRQLLGRECRFGIRSLLLVLMCMVSPGSGLAQGESCAPRHLDTAMWSTDFCNAIVDFEEILVGHPRKDGIPALTDPRTESIADAALWLSDRSPLIALEIDGEARAYPLAVLMWHEIANDTLADVPVAVTFCPLCNSSLTFDRRVGDETLDFGVSGLLRFSDLVMYDRQTETWWQQLTGEGMVGDYAGALLDIVPSQVISFASFVERYPEGTVISRDTGHRRQYGINPYAFYDSRAERPFLFRGELDTRLSPPVAYVLAATVDGVPVAYPFTALRKHRVINDNVADAPVVIFFQDGVATAMGASVIDNAADLGTAAMYRAELDGRRLTFTALPDGAFQDDETASTWNAFGEAIDGELAGSELEWIDAFPHFWFAWAAFYPKTLLYTGESGSS